MNSTTLKQIMDFDTTKVLLATISGLTATAATLDWLFRAAISIFTLWYLWRKIHQIKKQNEKDNDDELE